MTKTIFLYSFLVGITVLILSAVLVFGVQYTQTKDETFEALRQEAVYAEQGLMMGGTEYLEKLGDINHITWINENGDVIFDNVKNAVHANQKAFPEVLDALKNGSGQGIRKAEENGKSAMYFALRCSDGTVLRLGRPTSALSYAFEAISPIFWIIVIVVIISGILSYRAARQIVRPINNIDLDSPDISAYPELEPLVNKIQEQKLTIQEEAAGREEMRREFTANVTHELKTPLTSISGFAELMAQGNIEPEKVKEFSSDIYKESQRLIALIEDIIQLSRLDEEAAPPPTEDVDLFELAEDVRDSLAPVAERAKIALNLTGGPATVKGAYSLLYEMVYNLCDNSLKYNHIGGKVDIAVTESEKDIRLSVADNGIGISPEDQKRIFERFYRVDKSHSKEVGGTGLGLSIVKHGAQYHNARVELKSEIDVGTTITLIFDK